MIIIKGRSVFGGIAKGKISYYHRDEVVINKLKVVDPEREWGKYLLAKSESMEELKKLQTQATEDIGKNDAQIFYIHQMILNDSQFERLIYEYIMEKRYNADYAVARTAQTFERILANMDSEYIKERNADVNDISDRLIRHI